MTVSRRHLLLFALLAAPVVLTGCRVQPLYGSFNPVGPSESYQSEEDLRAIRIQPIPNRVGQQVHNALRNELTPSGQPSNPAYTLTTTIEESIGERLLATDATATRAQLRLRARYTLSLTANGTQLASGNATAISAYDIVETEYATHRAELDARARGAEEVARQIRTRLASWFIEARADGTLARKLYIGE
ncbi:LPS assembly lipoprotein LptE [Algihabitans albus]|uniref:LPS assembly lipoprotein LptE n=1 Tax=Algihabitans albus TaxID=2164067 RepID=UPI000E5D573A|nr:LPS assembly lipoprotein LptE [Algihabitans albus]